MRIIYLIDYNCPYSYIGLKRLQKAVENVGVDVEWEMRSFELEPTRGKRQTITTTERYAEKYGVPEEREKFNKVQDKFADILNSFSNNLADEKKLFDGFNEYTRWARHDSEFWRRQNYKQGIGDCICLISSIILLAIEENPC